MATESRLQLVIDAQDNASKVIAGLQGNLKSLQPTFKTMAVAGGIAFGAIATAIKLSVDEAAEAQKVQAQLAAVLKSTQGAAGLYIEDLNEQSAALQRMTTFSDEAIGSAQGLLLTFTNITGGTFQQATDIVADMSVALGQDLKSSAIQVGKALQDPILGVSALRRVGVNFSEAQQEVIKNLVNTGKAAEAQQLILRELNTEFGGSAQAQAKTYAGQMMQLKNTFNDVKEAIGTALLPILNKVVSAIKPIVDKMVEWAKNNPVLTKNIILIVGALTGLIALVGTLGLILPSIIMGFTALGAVLTFVAANPIVLAIGAIIAILIYLTVVVVKNWETIKATFVNVTTAIANFFVVAWNGIKAFFTTIWMGIVSVFDFYLAFMQGLAILFLDTFFPNWRDKWTQIQLFFIDLWNKIVEFFRTSLEKIKIVWNTFVIFFISIWTPFAEGFKAGWNTLWTGVANFFIGIWDGVKSAFKAVANFLIGQVNTIIAAVNRLIAGINRVATIGGRLGSGIPNIPSIPELATGGIVTKPTVAMVGEAGPEAIIPLNKGQGMGSNITINLTIGSIIGAGMSIDELTDMIGESLVGKIKANVRI